MRATVTRHAAEAAEERAVSIVKDAFDGVTAIPRFVSEVGGLRHRRMMKKRLRKALSDPRYEWRTSTGSWL
jgi:hypothetical protein